MNPTRRNTLGNLTGKHRPLVRGHPDRTIERRSAIPIEPHERVHAVGIEGDETPAGPQHSEDFRRAAGGVGQMMHDAAQQHAVETCRLEREQLHVPDVEFGPGIFLPADLDQLSD